TRFKVEEWDNEIPLGYSFWKYERVAGTYKTEEGDTPNSGWVRANDSPKMRVDNKRGWGIEVDKVWSDSDFVKSHDNIYTAIYVGEETDPLSGTIRQMPGKNTSIKYWLDSLGTHSFEQYKVYEVVLGGSYAVDADTGFVTPGQGFTVTKIDGQPININAVPKNSDTSTGYAYTVDYERGTPSSSTEGISGNIRTDTITNTRGGGIVLSLFDMRSNDDGIAQGSKTPVAGGTFTLMKGEEKIGEFTTDSKGRITVLYEIPFDTETGWSDYYTLTQTDTSTGYIGLEKPIKFRANTNTNAIEFVTENDAVWYSKETLPTTDDLIAFVNVYNKPFEFQVRKCREVTDETNDALWKSAWPCSGAHFELYCERPSLSGPVRDTSPMRGYEDLVTGTDGYIPKIDNTLEPGRYYLAETAAPQGFEKLNDEIVFVISDRGEITIESTLPKTHLISENVDGVAENTLYVPNKAIELLPPVLTINNHVDGTFGDKTKQFVYTFNVSNATLPAEGCEWYKNGVKQSEKLHNGSTFTLADGDTISIGVEIHNTSDNPATVTITEVNTPYTTTSTLNGTANPDGPEIFVQMYETRDPYDLDVTNTFDAVVPTGIFGNSVMPFVVLFVVMILGYVVYFVVKRRKK
ncbi:MAG: hypothetical protein IIZ22_00880, partial [Clostridia bacterium]|nr:hypothetical protein [Clostridia bacterium]